MVGCPHTHGKLNRVARTSAIQPPPMCLKLFKKGHLIYLNPTRILVSIPVSHGLQKNLLNNHSYHKKITTWGKLINSTNPTFINTTINPQHRTIPMTKFELPSNSSTIHTRLQLRIMIPYKLNNWQRATNLLIIYNNYIYI